MVLYRQVVSKFIATGIQRRFFVSFVLISLLTFTITVSAREKEIAGDVKLENEFNQLKVEQEFHLYVTDGFQEMADGELVYIWGYAHAKDFADVGEIKTKEERDAKLLPVRAPGDTIRLKSANNYVIVLHNAGWYETEKESGINHVAHTIHFHGLDLLPAYDGTPNLPYTPIFPGETYRYLLTIPDDLEGTYSGHCHVDSTNHILSGMFFPIVIEKSPNEIYGYRYDREYILVLSEIDSKYMEMLRTEGNIRRGLDWKSDYFMLNGRIFTDKWDNPLSTINDPKTRIVAYEGETVLIRLLAIGYSHVFIWHPHGYHGLIIGTDGRKLIAPYEKDTLCIGSGERYDILYKIPDFSSKRGCLSCNYGPGISIAHDHQLEGMVSQGIYPHGPLTIFDIRPKPKDTKPAEW